MLMATENSCSPHSLTEHTLSRVQIRASERKKDLNRASENQWMDKHNALESLNLHFQLSMIEMHVVRQCELDISLICGN